MTTTSELKQGYYDSAPIADNRTTGWNYMRKPGSAYQAGDTYYLTSYDAVRYAQRNPEIFSSAKAFDAISAVVKLIPLAVDPPEHKRYRRILDPMLAPKMIDRIEDRLRDQVRELIDAFATTGRCDVVQDIALKFPTQAILTLFGLPLEDLQQFLDWVDALIGGAVAELAAPSEAQMTAALGLFGYLQTHIERKRANPGDDMLSDILSLSGDDAWEDSEVLGLGFLFVLAGLDTVTATIGFTMMNLAENEQLRRAIIADPDLIAPFIEESVRLELPAPLTPRITTEEVEVDGLTIPADSRVMLVLATANREPENSDHPDTIDIEDPVSHLSFGGGVHRCLGSHLARRELRLTIEEFHARITDYHIPEGFTPQVVFPGGTLHLDSLPLEFTVE
ncbi:cytochrome [Williamsia sp. 1138]|uniref:cytochrome P450 n=1 Tax=Williamsia sp. 1138 TaxID=1903117 RepID=UPI000A10FE54|nr:cytochrome P450 [Williamsia sp. 1138]OZG28880.1 cytochrome [Williamsia sp. 1138]